MKETKPTLNVQHDYITLKVPHGTFTKGRNGCKATGVFAGEAFAKLDKFVHDKSHANYLDAMTKLTDAKFLETMVPDWNIAVEKLAEDDTVIATLPALLKEYPSEGKVTKVKTKYAYVKFPGEQFSIGIEMMYLKKVK